MARVGGCRGLVVFLLLLGVFWFWDFFFMGILTLSKKKEQHNHMEVVL